MKRKTAIIAASLAALLLAVAYYLYGGSAAPAGQKPLVRLNQGNITALEAAFNESSASIRVLVMLSPT